VRGETQVTLHLKASFGPFLSNLANNGEVVNQKAIESADPSRNAIGTGPFEFVEWVQGDHITLKLRTDQGRREASCGARTLTMPGAHFALLLGGSQFTRFHASPG
jgi:ABC-type transport system substrate-binding protein